MDIFEPPGAPVKGDPESPMGGPALGPLDDDIRWWSETSNRDAADFDVIEPEPSAFDALIVEMHDCLDAIAPLDDELAWRDLGDCGFGHPSGEGC